MTSGGRYAGFACAYANRLFDPGYKNSPITYFAGTGHISYRFDYWFDDAFVDGDLHLDALRKFSSDMKRVNSDAEAATIDAEYVEVSDE